jgi:hypothetical protein
MQRIAFGQLSFDAAPGRERREGDVLTSNISVSGRFEDEGHNALMAAMNPDAEAVQLSHGEAVLVTVADADGTVIAQANGTVAISFKDKMIEGRAFTIREQSVKL